jgi:hypothetical protein
VSCHVGPGAGALAQSKLDGLRRLRAFVSGHVTRPIPAPVADMRPARETCATCHWPDRIHGDRLKVVREYADDEASTETVTTLELKVGGGRGAPGLGEGIHWHSNPANRVEFVARDAARQDIPWVRLTAADGSVTEFRAPGASDAEIAAGTRRTMDCTDCHNRPSHTFAPSAERATDAAIAQGRVPRALPFVRREVVKALKVEAATQADALTAIDRGLREFYAGVEATARPAAADVDRVVTAAQAVYRGNVFPEMRITWGTYPSHLGHLDAPGCFRCHDGEKVAADGRTIGQDCETCHRMR